MQDKAKPPIQSPGSGQTAAGQRGAGKQGAAGKPESRQAAAGQSDDRNFLLQGTILAAAGIVVRLIGLVYRIPLTRILGEDGNGYYSTAYEIYNIGLILSSYSLPLATSKLIAARRVREQYQDIRRVFFSSLIFGMLAGGAMTLILLLGADWITATIFNSPNSALPLKVMAPTIFVFSVMGIIRGYFQGQGNMVPTSVSQIVEQMVNAVVSIGAAWFLMNRFAALDNAGSYGAAGGTLGTLSGAVAAFIFLLFLMIAYCRRNPGVFTRPQAVREESWKQVYGALFLTLTPIILSQFVYQLSGSVDNSMFGLIMGGKGLVEKERATLLGIYSSKYRLLSNVPVAIASALGTSMIPSIVHSRVQGDTVTVQKKIGLTIKFNMLIAIPCAVGLGVLASPIMRLIFGDSRTLTADLMRIGAPAVIFFSLSTVTNAVLQGVDLMRKSVTHSAISLVIHAALVYVMLNYLNLGVYGLVIGNVTFALVVCILNWRAIGRTLHYKQEVRTTFLLPLLSAGIMGAAACGIYALLEQVTRHYQIALLISIPAAVVVYGVLIVVTGAVTEEELPSMPFGRKLLRVCKRLRLIR